jgi:hypothetical protein
MFTRALHWSLSWARWIHSIPPHTTSLRFILTFSYHLRLGLPSGPSSCGFPNHVLYPSSSPPWVLHALPFSSFLIRSFQVKVK